MEILRYCFPLLLMQMSKSLLVQCTQNRDIEYVGVAIASPPCMAPHNLSYKVKPQWNSGATVQHISKKFDLPLVRRQRLYQ